MSPTLEDVWVPAETLVQATGPNGETFVTSAGQVADLQLVLADPEQRAALQAYAAPPLDEDVLRNVSPEVAREYAAEMHALTHEAKPFITRPYRTVDEQLEQLGIPKRTRERWANEISRCTTRYQLAIVMESHQIEAFLIGRSKWTL